MCSQILRCPSFWKLSVKFNFPGFFFSLGVPVSGMISLTKRDKKYASYVRAKGCVLDQCKLCLTVTNFIIFHRYSV